MEKKRFRLLAVGLAVCMAFLMPSSAWAEATVVDSQAAAYSYYNPKDIIIQAPGLTYKTSAKQVSIYGASDFEAPLYMNGQKITTTANGFFAQYVSLNVGDNSFVFENNGKTKTVVITRTQTSSGGGTSSKINIWGSNVKKYATFTSNNASHMATPGTDNDKLLMPIAEGTVVQLTGDAGNLYRLVDGTYVYKSSVKAADGVLPKANLSAMSLVPLTTQRCTELQIRTDQKAYYNLEMSQQRAILTVYNATHTATIPELPPNKIIKSVQLVSQNGGNVQYAIHFKENPPINGYYVEFADGVMKVGFKQKPVMNGKDLTGVVIHVDAGHGGGDPGAMGAAGTYGPTEKLINLRIAQSVKEYLQSRGATVTMTRTGDEEISLSGRAALVASAKPDFAISVHCNSMPVTANYNNAKGLLTFYSYDHSYAAKVVNDTAAAYAGMTVRSAQHKNLAMTRMTAYPAVLVESAFLSNPSDYELLINKEKQETLGTGIGKGVESYLLQSGVAKDVTVTINGQNLEMDQAPVIKEGRTLVPLRAIFEALGAQVQWNSDTQTVTASSGSIKIELAIGSSTMKVWDGSAQKNITLDVPAQLINDRTMVPVRAVSEAFSAEVDWDNDSRTVVIEK